MPTTPIFALPYPALTDAPNVPANMQSLATSVETAVANHALPVVNSTSEITAPFTGQLITSLVDNMVYRYSGSAWVAILALGGTTDPTRHEARYYQATSQTPIPDGQVLGVKFDVAQRTCNDVTADQNTGLFTLNRSGWWDIDTAVAVNSTGATGIGERLVSIIVNPTTVTTGLTPTVTGGISVARSNEHAGTSQFAFVAVSAGRPFTAGDKVIVTFHNNTTSGGMGTYVSGEQISLSLKWVRP